MADQKTIRINRRDFLKIAGLSLSAAGVSTLLQSCGSPTPTTAPAVTTAPEATKAAPRWPNPQNVVVGRTGSPRA